ncbi:MAG: hypothetical protein A3F74_13575 [Betaproteobacteria bacterium RIFCSPLOWO2_12_FULL_62_58]|nr:MAG: hypothetical protein A3F74_13575 [Betaproteobacteria bacterium RIFCSPLOWO2_12_FULL_62_58]
MKSRRHVKNQKMFAFAKPVSKFETLSRTGAVAETSGSRETHVGTKLVPLREQKSESSTQDQ